MKISEVQQPSHAQLFEAVNRDNDTGFASEDLVKILREHRSGQWSQPMTAQQLLESLNKGQ